MLEDNYGGKSFRIGSVRLTVDAGRHHSLRRLRGQALTTANVISASIAELSELLGVEYQADIQSLLDNLAEIGKVPERYSEVVKAGRRAGNCTTHS